MINNKYINIIAAIVMSIAVLFSGIIMYIPKQNNTIITSTKDDVNNVQYINKAFNKNEITDISINIAQDDLDWLIENATSEEYKSCDITINGETFYNVGIRPKGNSTLTQVASSNSTSRYSFKIKFDEYVKGQNYYGLSKMVLNNFIQDTTYMKEALSYDVLSFLDVATPAYAYTNITMNGEAWGFYLALEVVEDSFLERYYGTGDYNLYKPESMGVNAGGQGGNKAPGDQAQGGPPNGKPEGMENMDPEKMKEFMDEQMKNQDGNNGQTGMPPNMEQGDQNNKGEMNASMGAKGGSNLKYTDDNVDSYSVIKEGSIFKKTTDEDLKKVITMIKALNEGGADIQNYLDVDEVLRYLAANTFLVNLDSYLGGMYHNYYLLEQNGVCKILPWDYNLSFGGFRTNDAASAINFPIDNPTTDSLENAPLIGKLLENDEYKELYHSYLNKIVEEYVNNGTFENRVNEINTLINDSVKNDNKPFYTYEQYTASIPQLIQFGKDRAASVKAQLEGAQPSTTYGNLTTTVNLSALGDQGAGGNNMGKPQDKKPN
jgi:spore coat protein CotH